MALWCTDGASGDLRAEIVRRPPIVCAPRSRLHRSTYWFWRRFSVGRAHRRDGCDGGIDVISVRLAIAGGLRRRHRQSSCHRSRLKIFRALRRLLRCGVLRQINDLRARGDPVRARLRQRPRATVPATASQGGAGNLC